MPKEVIISFKADDLGVINPESLVVVTTNESKDGKSERVFKDPQFVELVHDKNGTKFRCTGVFDDKTFKIKYKDSIPRGKISEIHKAMQADPKVSSAIIKLAPDHWILLDDSEVEVDPKEVAQTAQQQAATKLRVVPKSPKKLWNHTHDRR